MQGRGRGWGKEGEEGGGGRGRADDLIKRVGLCQCVRWVDIWLDVESKVRGEEEGSGAREVEKTDNEPRSLPLQVKLQFYHTFIWFVSRHCEAVCM